MKKYISIVKFTTSTLISESLHALCSFRCVSSVTQEISLKRYFLALRRAQTSRGWKKLNAPTREQVLNSVDQLILQWQEIPFIGHMNICSVSAGNDDPVIVGVMWM